VDTKADGEEDDDEHAAAASNGANARSLRSSKGGNDSDDDSPPDQSNNGRGGKRPTAADGSPKPVRSRREQRMADRMAKLRDFEKKEDQKRRTVKVAKEENDAVITSLPFSHSYCQ
jgi:hypothetical protein